MKNVKNILASKRAKAGLLITSALGSASAFAADHTAALQAAADEGSANYALVITGVITLAAISFGVGMIVSWLRK